MRAMFNPETAARWIMSQHLARSAYVNLPEDIGPTSVEEAYAAQEALHRLMETRFGPVAGLKIATTTRVMQQLMGIDHPCGGAIFEKRIHTSPARIERGEFVNLVMECELAVRLAVDLAAKTEPWTRETVRLAVATVMPAFELIEDRNAVYLETRALSLIADNAWNGGIVLGRPVTNLAGDLNGIRGELKLNGEMIKAGNTDDPLGALAWVANLAIARGRPLRAGQVVITGSVIPTLPTKIGDTFSFSIEGLGETSMHIA